MRWAFVTLILIASIGLATFMLDSMGLIDVKASLLARLEQSKLLQEHIAVYRLGLEAESAIEQERQQLTALEAELAAAIEEAHRLQKELESERVDIDRQWALLEQARRQLDARQATVEAQVERVADFQRLQQLYNQMRPSDLVAIFEEMDDDLVARILAGMSSGRAASTLAAMDPTRAAELSKRLGGVSSK